MREALLAAGLDCPPSATNFVLLPGLADRADELEEQCLVVRRVTDGIRITVRLPAENDRILAALGVAPPPAETRSALVLRTSAETASGSRLSMSVIARATARRSPARMPPASASSVQLRAIRASGSGRLSASPVVFYTPIDVPAINLNVSGTNGVLATITNLAGGSKMIEFPATPGKTYTIVYASDLSFSDGRTAQPSIVAPANRVQWIDSGPPKTVSHPNSTTNRVYRVFQSQ